MPPSREFHNKGGGLVREGDVKDTQAIFSFMNAHRAEFRMKTMLRVFEVSRSGYHSWVSRRKKKEAKAKAAEALLQKIKRSHMSSSGTYGTLRIHADLVKQGDQVSLYATRKSMRENGIRGMKRSRFKTTTKCNPAHQASADLVNRDFTADRPDELWVADSTYIHTGEGTLYLATILDVFSRLIVGWAASSRHTAELMKTALTMAVEKRGGDVRSVIHHSDHGSQYTSNGFRALCEKYGVEQSMGTVGDCYDNAMSESLNATIEVELLNQNAFETRREAKWKLFKFIEGFYNRRRLHSSLEYVSPMEFEQMYEARKTRRQVAEA